LLSNPNGDIIHTSKSRKEGTMAMATNQRQKTTSGGSVTGLSNEFIPG
jgi:hypothetical protein